jgi:hypothetical protein
MLDAIHNIYSKRPAAISNPTIILVRVSFYVQRKEYCAKNVIFVSRCKEVLSGGTLRLSPRGENDGKTTLAAALSFLRTAI